MIKIWEQNGSKLLWAYEKYSHSLITGNVLRNKSQELVPKLQTSSSWIRETSRRDQILVLRLDFVVKHGYFTRWDLSLRLYGPSCVPTYSNGNASTVLNVMYTLISLEYALKVSISVVFVFFLFFFARKWQYLHGPRPQNRALQNVPCKFFCCLREGCASLPCIFTKMVKMIIQVDNLHIIMNKLTCEVNRK